MLTDIAIIVMAALLGNLIFNEMAPPTGRFASA